MTASNQFYEMIKKWTVMDYRTPGVKAEVIIDMLISDHVCDIVGSSIGCDDLELVAKEFPIRACVEEKGAPGHYKLSSDNRPARIDYVLRSATDKSLYFVELKTDKKSYDDKQLLRMVYAALMHNTSRENIFDTFGEFHEHTAEKTKYDHQINHMPADIMQEASEYNIEIVYLTLTGVKNQKGKPLYLSDKAGRTLEFVRVIDEDDLIPEDLLWEGKDADVKIRSVRLTDFEYTDKNRTSDKARNWEYVKEILTACITTGDN